MASAITAPCAVHSFIRVVREAGPEYFAFEEVPGFPLGLPSSTYHSTGGPK